MHADMNVLWKEVN